jgi:uncharacterized short protein YbdD (DUF466 family)
MEAKVCRWFFPTNHENLKAILSYSLLCGSSGYKKYYRDVSSKHPGYIPVFQDSSKKFHDARQDALKERDGMTSCLLEIDVNQLLQTTESNTQFELFLTAPLPISCVKQVIFKSTKEKDDFRKSAVDNFGDIPNIKEIVFKSEKRLFDEPPSSRPSDDLFSQSINSSIDISTEQFDEISVRPPVFVDYQKVLSYGGMICMLFYFAKNGSKGNEEFNALAKGEKTTFSNEEKKNYGKLSEAICNFYDGESNSPIPSLASITIIEEVINILCKEDVPQQRTAILEKLRGGLFRDHPDKQKRAIELADHLESFYKRKIDKKTSDIFGEASSELERLLLYLFHKDMPEKIADDIFSKLGLGEEEIVLTGMLAGARFGFNNIHNDLRQYQGLYYYVSYQMAQYAHNFSKSGIEFKEVDQPKTVFEIVEQKNMARGKKLDFLNWFTKKYKEYDMTSCFETKISGQYVKEFLKEITNNVKQSFIDLLSGDSSKIIRTEKINEIVFRGIVGPDFVIKHDKYFEKMRDISISSEEYEELLKKCK